MAEAAEETITQEPIAPVEDAPGTEVPTLPEPTQEREPDGDSPEAVFARKQYRTAKRVEQELQAERVRAAELEGRLRALEETKKTPAPKKVFSIAEVSAAVEAGTITQMQAYQYLNDEVVPARINEIFDAREQAAAKKAPLQRAAETVNGYIDQIPGLRDKTSDDFRKVALQYSKLVSEDGHPPDDARTHKLALQLTYGDLDTVKRRTQMAQTNATPRTIPSDAGAGGGHSAANGKIDVSKAPKELVEIWDNTNTPKDARERQFKYYLERQAIKK